MQNALWLLYAGYLSDFALARLSVPQGQGPGLFFTIYGFWSWLTGTHPADPLLILSTALGTAVALAVWHRRMLTRRQAILNDSPAAWVYIAAVPLLSPMSEVHHLTSLLPAAAYSVAACAGYVEKAGLVLSAVLLWLGWLDPTGPWYFLAVLALISSAAVVLSRVSDQAAPAELLSPA